MKGVLPFYQPEKTKVMSQDVSTSPRISIGDHTLEVVEEFTSLESTMFNNLSLDPELNCGIGKALTSMARLTKRLWENSILTVNTRMNVYQACVFSSLLYGSEVWAPLCSSET